MTNPHTSPEPTRRNVLLITVDQMRFDALRHAGNSAVSTPNLDRIAREGLRFDRCHVTNVTCTPSRSSLLTGQLPRTHGAWANGAPLPHDAPSIAGELHERAGYATALIGKGHFEPAEDPDLRFDEARMAAEGTTGPYRGFEHVELAGHGPFDGHYGRWMHENHPEVIAGFLNPRARRKHPSGGFGGDTMAPDVLINHVPEELYHTAWVADRSLEWLRQRRDDEPWLLWVSFPDPHHPWDPPASRRRDHPWRERELPPYYPGSPEAAARILAGKPAHWLGYWDGSFKGECSRHDWAASNLTPDQLREITAMIDIEIELIDEAVGRLLAYLDAHGIVDTTDVFFTADHGEFQGDFGLLFKGSYHCDALMRVPLLWRPAPVADISPGLVTAPVSQIGVTAAIAEAAGLPVPDWVQGQPLSPDGAPEALPVLTEYDSPNPEVGMHLRTIHLDGFTCTVYEPSTIGRPTGLERHPRVYGHMPVSSVAYNGSEGELYDLTRDPREHHNLWGDPAHAQLRHELVDLLHASLPSAREPRPLIEAAV